jgi:dTDP-L-rhamnose 4-epimerase
LSTNILITGGSGFIGSHLRNRLLASGHRVTIFGRSATQWSLPVVDQKDLTIVHADLSDKQALAKALKDIEIVFHNAASYGPPAADNDQNLFNSNVRGTESLVAALSNGAEKIQRVILSSSISVYGEGRYHCENCGDIRPNLRTAASIEAANTFAPLCPGCGGNIEPTATPESAVLNGSSDYASSKKIQEQLIESASRDLNFSAILLRYATVYGAFQRDTNFYTRFMRALINGGSVSINEDGEQKRDFIYIDDVIHANELAMEAPLDGCATFNIGTGSEVALIDFVIKAKALIEAQLGRRTSEVTITNKFVEGDIRNCKIDCGKASQVLGFKPTTDWSEGLERWLHILNRRDKCPE